MQPEARPETLQGETPALSAAPLDASKRENFLDALRGLALFGILTVNLEHFAGVFAYASAHPSDIGVDFAQSLIAFLFSGKFYTLFSLLFGLGLALQYRSLQQKNLDPLPYLRRRLGWLLLFGLLHGTLLFDGDILGLYALVGLFCLRYLGQEHRLWNIAKFLLLGWVVVVLFYWGNFSTGVYFGNYLSTSFLEVSQERFGFWFPNTLVGALLFGLEFAGLFVLGMWLAFRWPSFGTQTLWRTIAISLAVGIPVNWFNATLNQTEPLRGLGGLCFALVFAALFRLYWPQLGWLQNLKYAGRMPLTNYLTQSLMMSTLFYGYGFRLYGQVHPLWFPLIALIVVFVQVLFSRWWLSRFSQGPMEGLWRRLMYGS